MTTNAVTMTTVEIAELTGKRHAHVLRDARKMVAQVNEPKFGSVNSVDLNEPKSESADSRGAHSLNSKGVTEATYLDGKREARPMLVLDKHWVFTLITGYDVTLRHTVIGRWIELEQANDPSFGSKGITETLNDLQARVLKMAPAFFEHQRKGRAEGYSWREACRIAGINWPDKTLAHFIASGRARRKDRLTHLHPQYVERGFAKTLKKTDLVVSKNGGLLFKVTEKGLNDWLMVHATAINTAVLKAMDKTDRWGRVIKTR